MQTKCLLAAGALAACTFGANAAIYDISATASPHPFLNVWPSIAPDIDANGFTLPNGGPGSLTYSITPVDQAGGGLYTAALRFSTASPPAQGWEWNYWVQIDAATPYQVGYGGALGDATPGVPPPWNGYGPGGVASTPGDYAFTAAAAFAQAPGLHSFSLAPGQSARIYWLDDHWGDNSGGISLNVTVVPEPEAYGLALAGMGVVAFAMRRRTPRPLY